MLKAIFNRAELVKALALVGAVVLKRTPKPILACVRLEANDKIVRIAGTDLETAVIVDFHTVEIEQAGVAVLNLQELLQTLKASNAESVSLQPREDDGVPLWRLADHDSEFTIAAAKPDEFPALPGSPATAPAAGSFTVNRDHLIRGISYVSWAIGASERYAFDSICFSLRQSCVHLVTSDSRTMAVADLGGLGEGSFKLKALDGKGEFVLPDRIAKLLTAAAKFVEGDTDDVSASFAIETLGTDDNKYDSLERP